MIGALSSGALSLVCVLAAVACHAAPPPGTAASRTPKHVKAAKVDDGAERRATPDTHPELPHERELAIVEVESVRNAFGGHPLRVLVNNVQLGETPLVVRLPAGNYTLVAATPQSTFDVGIALSPGAHRRVTVSEAGVQVLTDSPTRPPLRQRFLRTEARFDGRRR